MVNYKRGSGNYKSSYLQIVIKKATQSIAQETTVQDDDELFLPLKANTSYAGFLLMYINCPSIADIKYTFKAITGASYSHVGKGYPTSPASVTNFGTNKTNNTDGGDEVMVLSFSIKLGTTAGILQFQWSQQTSNESASRVLVGTMLVCYEA